MVADLAALTPADDVVDIGCGPGGAVAAAAHRGARATGVDPPRCGWIAGRPVGMPTGRCAPPGRSRTECARRGMVRRSG
jgi:hypothetical protein